MHLKDLADNLNRPLVIPLMGYTGTQLNHSTIKQNEFNWGLQAWTIHELAKRFEPDAIFFMMDLAVEANALGLPVRFPLEESSTVEYPLVKQLPDLYRFLSLDPLKDGLVMAFVETMRFMNRTIDIPKGAYVIGPFTLTGLLMGATEVAVATIRDPGLVIGVLEFCTGMISRYAQALVAAGADIIAILEPIAVMLSPGAFWEFSGQFVKRIMEQIPIISMLHICGNTTHLISSMVQTNAQALSLDSLVDLPAIAQSVPESVFLIGNIDRVRVMLQGTPDQVRRETSQLLEQMAPCPNFILSTGCDLQPETPLKNIEAFMEVGKSWKRK
jgi:uroporphyrinogen decarboxylase